MKKYRLFLAAMVLSVFAVTLQVQTSATSQSVVYAACQQPSDQQNQPVPPVSQNCIYKEYVDPAINFLSIGVGVIVVAMVILGAIQYSASAGNPQAVAGARKRIISALIALLLYALTYAFLNFIIPGGLIPT